MRFAAKRIVQAAERCDDRLQRRVKARPNMENEVFAKIFGSEDDQILAKLDSGDTGPEIRFFCEPKGLGVCSLALEFPDTDYGWDKAEAAFAEVDETLARKVVGALHKQAGELTGHNA